MDMHSRQPDERGRAGPKSALSGRKKLVFRLIAVSAPLVVLVLLELLLRVVPGTDRDRHLNISPFSIFTTVTVDGQPHYKITHRFVYQQRDISFPIAKPSGTIRLFCLGGSASAGWPHPAQETYSAYLQQALTRAYPDRSVELIDVSAHGFASYRVRHIFDEVVKLQPDALVIYSGNNEFLEKREYERTSAALDSLAEHLYLVRWLLGLASGPKTNMTGDELHDIAAGFMKKVKRQALELRSDPAKFEMVKRHYAQSIEYMVAQAQQRAVPVLLATVPVNLRDWLPTVSDNRLQGAQLAQWQQLYDRGRKHELQGDTEAGIASLRQAIRLQPWHAESHFWLGRLLASAGRSAEALESYRTAKDLDFNPFRAHSAFNQSLRRIARRYDNATLVDLDRLFIEADDDGVPGFDLFLDYVHPTKRGNLLIAEAVFDALVQGTALKYRPVHTTFFYQDQLDGATGLPYDAKLNLPLQMKMFGFYSINHQYAATIAKAEHIRGLIARRTQMGEPLDVTQALLDRLKQGYEAFVLHQKVRRQEILGEHVNPDEKARAKQLLDDFYSKWYQYGTF